MWSLEAETHIQHFVAEPGRLMAQYYLGLKTMQAMTRVPQSSGMEQLLLVLGQAQELSCESSARRSSSFFFFLSFFHFKFDMLRSGQHLNSIYSSCRIPSLLLTWKTAHE